MTEHRKPPACHYDRQLGERVTREHRDDCTNPADHQGCAPCTAPHCVLCSRRHLDNDHPLTCDECIGAVRTDLDEIRWLARHLRWQAARAGRDGRLLAAAPIPGGDAMVVLARSGVEEVRTFRGWTADHHDQDHRAKDPTPLLLPLVAWEEVWRTHLGHQLRTAQRAPVTAITQYLASHLTRIAQDLDAPDWQGFADAMAILRRQLEGVLHDEQEPERGVSCFECGDQLVRRFGNPKPCRHVGDARRAGVTVAHWVYLLSTYPELKDDHTQCRDQGGIANPEAGQSWECQGCRKHYDHGEYAHAVRRDLLEGGPDGDGWTHITMAAEAATMMTSVTFGPERVRRWMDRGRVSAMCRWSSTVDGKTRDPRPAVPRPEERESFGALVEEFAGRVASVQSGLRLVLWGDVKERAADAVVRAHMLELERRREAEQEDALRKAVASGLDAEEAGKRLGIHPARVEKFEARWAAEARREARRDGRQRTA